MHRLDKYDYTIAALFALITGALVSWYLFLRQGYLDLFTVNKVAALVALILIGVVLLIGPLSRIYAVYTVLLKYRKALGRLAFLFGVVHAILSYFFLFPLDQFTVTNLPFLFGLASLCAFMVLFLFSFEKLMQLVDRRAWWRLQNIGVRLIGVFGVVHFALQKYKNWISWLHQSETGKLLRPQLPPESLLLFIFAAYILVVRLYDHMDRTRARLLVLLSFILLLVILIGSFIFVRSSARPPDELTWEACNEVAGRVIEEKTYPPTCVTPDGRQAVQPYEVSDNEGSGEYFGSSTFSACNVDTDCKISGCNGEICQGAGELEQSYSICVTPDGPTPLELKLSCGCQSSLCQWQ